MTLSHRIRIGSCLLCAYLIYSGYLYADEFVNPEYFEWISRTSLNLTKAYREYESHFETQNLKFMFDINLTKTSKTTYIAPTSTGQENVEMMNYTGALYFRPKSSQNYSVGFLTVAMGVGIGENLYRATSSEVWSNEYRLSTLIIKSNVEDSKMIVGVMQKLSPLITTDSEGNKVFDYGYDEEDGKIGRAEQKNENLFLQVRKKGFDILTIYSFSELKFDLFESQKIFRLSKNLGILSPGFNYYKFLDTRQIGGKYYEFTPFNFISAGLESYFDIDKMDLAYALFYGSLYFLKDDIRKKGAESVSGKDFHIQLSSGISYSKEIYHGGLSGYSASLSFENVPILRMYARFILGLSRNYHKGMYRLPVKDDTLILTSFQLQL